MPERARNHIVENGRWRILDGSGREVTARIRARFARRTAPLLERAGPVGRLIIRYRISRFIQRRLHRLAPPEALYSSQRLSPSPQESILSEVSRNAARNV